MVAWWESLTTLERVFAYAAIPSTVLLLVQSILLMIGIAGQNAGDVNMESDTSGLIDTSGEGDMDLDHDVPDMHMEAEYGEQAGHIVHDPGLRILTMRGLIAFFSVGGWTGLALLRGQFDRLASGILAILAGLSAMVALAWLLKVALSLQSDGSMDLRNAVGTTGTVYLTIPADRSAKGKVMVMVQGQLRELDAVTESDTALKAGSYIRVVGVLNGDTLVVSEAARAAGSGNGVAI